MPADPAWSGYLADPVILPALGGYVAYGTAEPGRRDGVAVEALVSRDLRSWRSAGAVLRADPHVGTDYWAPEVVHAEGAWWMYYSAGRGIDGHHLRVARADSPVGRFVDQGINLTPDESFAIDAHPFQDADGSWYLYYARDVLDGDRPGTHLAVRRMRSWTELGAAHPVLAPNAPWQMYEAGRRMYGRRMDWYTLEGPTVIRRGHEYVLLYSGGSWEGQDYGVSWATAPGPFGPWTHASAEPAVLSAAITGQSGPGHCSLLELPGDQTAIVYHAWDATRTTRQMHIAALKWQAGEPRIDVAAALSALTLNTKDRAPQRP